MWTIGSLGWPEIGVFNQYYWRVKSFFGELKSSSYSPCWRVKLRNKGQPWKLTAKKVETLLSMFRHEGLCKMTEYICKTLVFLFQKYRERWDRRDKEDDITDLCEPCAGLLRGGKDASCSRQVANACNICVQSSVASFLIGRWLKIWNQFYVYIIYLCLFLIYT